MPISFNELGNLGHIGNQMFQYASLQGIAKNRNFDWIIPPKNEFGKNYPVKNIMHNLFYLDSGINFHEGITDYHSITEVGNGFNKDLFDNCPDQVNLSGYFQSYKYFENIEKKIRRDFTFLPDMNDRTPRKNTLSIHVRRGDYLGIKNHLPPMNIEYYSYALDFIGSFNHAIVFSDDIEWCKGQDLFKNFEFSQGDSYSDFRLMSKCDKHIIANSTFSWWAAWLSQADSVVCPAEWFGPALPTHTPDGYHVPGWQAV
jgi:hypothetical protein